MMSNLVLLSMRLLVSCLGILGFDLALMTLFAIRRLLSCLLHFVLSALCELNGSKCIMLFVLLSEKVTMSACIIS